MYLYGLKQVRTNNFTDPQMVNKIKQVWEQSLLELPKKASYYGIYHAFESNYQGDYTLTVASEVNRTKTVFTIDKQANYQPFIVNTSQVNGIYQTWQKIWQLEVSGQLNRAYQQDFEFYNGRGDCCIYIEVIK